MSDGIIGPASCVYCGGEYGEHEPDCMRPAARECICPVVTIVAQPGHVTEEQQNQIARDLWAQVSLVTGGDGTCAGRTVFGKHRDDCPCRRR